MLTPLSSAFQRTLVPALTPSEQKDGSEAKSQYTEVLVALVPRWKAEKKLLIDCFTAGFVKATQA